MPITFVRMVKFKSHTQFLVDHLSHRVMTCLVPLLCYFIIIIEKCTLVLVQDQKYRLSKTRYFIYNYLLSEFHSKVKFDTWSELKSP